MRISTYKHAMTIEFSKMHGLGNDFVIIDARQTGFEPTTEFVQAISDRKWGVGCDQMILLSPTDQGGDTFMRIWNADGGEVEACGNASRCVGRLLFTEATRESAVIDTVAGALVCFPANGDNVTVDMGSPRLDWQDIPLAEEMDTRILDIRMGPIDAPVLHSPSAVNTGNPHCIFFVENVAAHELESIGPMIENHPLFPERTNVELAQVVDRNEIRLRVWERGTGITQACGTGACATAVAAIRKGMTDRVVQIHLDGGTLQIEWREDDGHMLMTGPAALSFTGTLAEEFFS